MKLDQDSKSVFILYLDNISIIGNLQQIKSGALLKTQDNVTKVEIDLSVNKVLEVYNSYLLYTYTMIDKRFMEMIVLLKNWNKNKFPDASQRLNSYSLVMMVLAFLQKEKILPNLQKMSYGKKLI